MESNVKKMLHETVLPKLKLLQSQFKELSAGNRQLQQSLEQTRLDLDQAEQCLEQTGQFLGKAGLKLRQTEQCLEQTRHELGQAERFAKLKGIRLDQAEDTIDLLVNELSRYKNDSNELLMSVYAFCKVNNVNFYTNELSVFGYDLTRISKARGFHMETTYDSRYGTVGLYDQQLMCEYFNLETTDGATNV
jgi:hypothetical protein